MSPDRQRRESQELVSRAGSKDTFLGGWAMYVASPGIVMAIVPKVEMQAEKPGMGSAWAEPCVCSFAGSQAWLRTRCQVQGICKELKQAEQHVHNIKQLQAQ